MKEGYIDFAANPRLISKEHLEEWSVKAKPTKDDIVLSRRCNPGATAYVPGGVEFALGQNLVLLRSSGEDVFPPFLRWLVQGPEWWAEIDKYLNVGSVFDSLRCADIPNFEFLFPPLPEQKAIAHILGSLDDKIELNRRMNATLEGLAQALFQSWFVDFDPVVDNALAADNPIPDELTDRAALRRQALDNGTANREAAQHFPASFQLTEELGWIPEGWEVQEIRNRAETIQYGLTQSASDEECGPKFLRITDIRGGEIKWDQVPYCEVSQEEFEKYRINEGDIFVARTGASTGENVYVTNPLDSVFASYLVRLTFEDKAIGRLVGMFMRSGKYFEFIEGILSGSAQPNASAQALASAQMAFPQQEAANIFYDKITVYDKRRAMNESEIRTLTKLRDTLLPQLISGELRIPDAAKLAEAALA